MESQCFVPLSLYPCELVDFWRLKQEADLRRAEAFKIQLHEPAGSDIIQYEY